MSELPGTLRFQEKLSMTNLTLFHTAENHCSTFDALAQKISPHATLTHVVRPDWLHRARFGVDSSLSAEIKAEVGKAENALCTCTSIADIAAQAGALRIDRPMMDAAAATGGPVLMVFCLKSTLRPSTELLTQAFLDIGRTPRIQPLPLTELWSMFGSGKTKQFTKQIAKHIDATIAEYPDMSCVVLAQASMAQAALYVVSDIPIFSSPELALRHALNK